MHIHYALETALLIHLTQTLTLVRDCVSLFYTELYEYKNAVCCFYNSARNRINGAHCPIYMKGRFTVFLVPYGKLPERQLSISTISFDSTKER